MMVLVCDNTPPAVRGMLKRWFVEPKPNVFVGTVNPRTRDKTIEYIRRHAPDLGMLILASDEGSQGFTMINYGDTKRRREKFSGLWLIAENWNEEEEEKETNSAEEPSC